MSTCPYEPRDDSRPCQGSLYRNIKAIVSAKPTLVPREIDFSEWLFPYAVTLSQECDLVQDHKIRTQKGSEHTRKNDDKLIPTILMCPAYPSNPFRDGRHLQALKWEMEPQNSKAWDLIKKNQNPRYHFLAAWPKLQVAELVVDFKHFFTIPTELLRETYGTEEYYIARLTYLYREDLSQRFAAYLARIGIPIQHHKVETPT